jgi:hypothetical protein
MLKQTCNKCSPFLAIWLFCLFLTSCGSQPIVQGDETQVDDIEVAEQVRDILDQANTSESPERDKYYLQAAALLATTGELDWARNLLASIDPDLLFVEDFVDYTLLYSQIAIDTDAYFLAQRILTNPRVEQQWESYSNDDAKLLRARRAELFALLGEANKSVYERVRLSDYNLDLELVQSNQDAIWESLMALSQEELNQLSLNETNNVLKGWYTLAALSKNSDTNLDRQQATIELWMSEWSNHPARYRLPTDLQLLKQLVEDQPRSVALLLPLSHTETAYSQAAKQIRDGFMAAYFQSMQKGSRVPQVRIFDTSQSDINSVYDLAVADGAEFIIGPLIKDNVRELSLRLEMPVPILTLNEIDQTPYGYPSNFYQFSLNPEGEAIQVANRAWLEGHRRAMVLVPQNATGSRSADAFTNAWESLGGKVVQRSYFDDRLDYSNYSTVIKEGLLIGESEARRQAIRNIVGTNIEYEPRRRQDIDFVFLFAYPEEAQGIKPTLKLHHAANVPVYATRRVFAGNKDTKNRDLNGIRFNTLPWLFANDSIKQTFTENTRNPNNEFYAMGVDSYRLYPRLPQLEQRQGAKFYGETGALHLSPERKFQRDQVWAHIVNGEAQALPMVVSEAYVE